MRRPHSRLIRPWAMIMAIIAALTLATPVNAEPISTSSGGANASEPRMWRTTRGYIYNRTNVTWTLSSHSFYPSDASWLERPPAEIKPDFKVTFATGYDSHVTGSGYWVEYVSGSSRIHVEAYNQANSYPYHKEWPTGSYRLVFDKQEYPSPSQYDVWWDIKD
ncbi:hypothetical protein [Actinosynnema sp. NPDC023587]|uniref:hypothetical protein n=1 Tax=Actinosynnema sp. NPDC023587 TaxID=3154695 RepID=UPI00340B0E3E